MAVKKTPAKKPTRKAAKKTVRKTKVVKEKVAHKNTPRKVTAYKDPLPKSAIIRTIAESTGLKKADVVAVMEEFNHLIECHIGPKNSAGSFTIPGVLKIQRIFKAAKKERKGINPFTGEETMFKAKPAHFVVKIRALKKLKDIAGKK